MNVIEPKKVIQHLKDTYGDYIFYYLLYWKKHYPEVMIAKLGDKKLYELTDAEYVQLFEIATEFDKKRLKHEQN